MEKNKFFTESTRYRAIDGSMHLSIRNAVNSSVVTKIDKLLEKAFLMQEVCRFPQTSKELAPHILWRDILDIVMEINENGKDIVYLFNPDEIPF
ncbi:MAG TPA: hypothetical protein VN278_06965 [Methanosarcina sp.]|nr:hypothetical protein [Methanosarcina sp.]